MDDVVEGDEMDDRPEIVVVVLDEMVEIEDVDGNDEMVEIEEITIDDLSQFAGYSRAHLSRQFKKATGLSIVEYINYIRCTNAHTMLVGENKTVSEVALECGFSNMSYFSKIYKRVIGKLPSVDSK